MWLKNVIHCLFFFPRLYAANHLFDIFFPKVTTLWLILSVVNFKCFVIRLHYGLMQTLKKIWSIFLRYHLLIDKRLNRKPWQEKKWQLITKQCRPMHQNYEWREIFHNLQSSLVIVSLGLSVFFFVGWHIAFDGQFCVRDEFAILCPLKTCLFQVYFWLDSLLNR